MFFAGLLIREVDRNAAVADMEDDTGTSQSDSAPLPKQRLLSRYKTFRLQRSTTQDSSTDAQIRKYFECINDCDSDALTFWSKNRERFSSLHSIAMKVLSVPASSAPVERVFSRGGIFMRPHRTRLGFKLLQSLIFLKCNQPSI